MNLLNKKWINTGNLNVIYKKNNIIIENNSDTHKFLIYPHIFKCTDNKEISLNFRGNLIYGTGCTLKILNRHKNILGQCGLNSLYHNTYELLKYFIFSLYIPSHSKIEITKLEYIKNPLKDTFFDHTMLLKRCQEKENKIF